MISYNNNMDNTTQRGTLNQKEITLFSFDKSLKEQVRVSETIYVVDLWTWPSGQEEVIAGHIKLSVEDIKELLELLNQLLES